MHDSDYRHGVLPKDFDLQEPLKVPPIGYWSTGSSCIGESEYVVARTEELNAQMTPLGAPFTTEERVETKRRKERRLAGIRESKRLRQRQEVFSANWLRCTRKYKRDMLEYMDECQTSQGNLYKGVEDIVNFEKKFYLSKRGKRLSDLGTHLNLCALCNRLAEQVHLLLGIISGIPYYLKEAVEKGGRRMFPRRRIENWFSCSGRCNITYLFTLHPTSMYLVDAILEFAELHLQCVPSGAPRYKQQNTLKVLRSHRPAGLPIATHVTEETTCQS